MVLVLWNLHKTMWADSCGGIGARVDGGIDERVGERIDGSVNGGMGQ